MTGTDKVFAGTIPEIYQRYLVPMIFEPYAKDMADRVARLCPLRVLELAAGTGVATRAIASQLGTAAEIVATDLNQSMLDAAANLESGQGKVTFRQADALSLPFEDESFDLVLCQFGVMFFPDKLQSYREARRVLKPRGTYIFAVWDQLSSNEFVTVANAALASRFPDDPPRFMERTPHGYYDTRAILNAVKEAGFTEASVETVDKIARAGSAHDAATGYCQGNPLRAEIEARAPGKLQAVTDVVATALAERFGHSGIEGKIRAHVITARR
ncbi:class I SAM-dependent methyltransferase [Agrobacterium rhizogenes]|nr:class I SAM-dependent methyltransferase [Rhizobium rhizogenes]NTJ79141.1 class I SAM-dependent methyltransferase [Rhizobium rhizogenes]